MEIILGVIVSLAAQLTKKLVGLGEWGSLAAVAILSLGGAIFYTWLSTAGYWESVKQILITAGAFYAFVVLRFPGASSSEA